MKIIIKILSIILLLSYCGYSFLKIEKLENQLKNTKKTNTIMYDEQANALDAKINELQADIKELSENTNDLSNNYKSCLNGLKTANNDIATIKTELHTTTKNTNVLIESVTHDFGLNYYLFREKVFEGLKEE